MVDHFLVPIPKEKQDEVLAYLVGMGIGYSKTTAFKKQPKDVPTSKGT